MYHYHAHFTDAERSPSEVKASLRLKLTLYYLALKHASIYINCKVHHPSWFSFPTRLKLVNDLHHTSISFLCLVALSVKQIINTCSKNFNSPLLATGENTHSEPWIPPQTEVRGRSTDARLVQLASRGPVPAWHRGEAQVTPVGCLRSDPHYQLSDLKQVRDAL